MGLRCDEPWHFRAVWPGSAERGTAAFNGEQSDTGLLGKALWLLQFDRLQAVIHQLPAQGDEAAAGHCALCCGLWRFR